MANRNAALIQKAVFVSGRDEVSATAFRNVLKNSKNPVVRPEEVSGLMIKAGTGCPCTHVLLNNSDEGAKGGADKTSPRQTLSLRPYRAIFVIFA